MLLKNSIISVRTTIVYFALTGLLFPLVMTPLCRMLFPWQSGGSLVERRDGRVIGSALLAQPFKKPAYFHPRPSAAGSGYAGEASGGTNLGPTSQKLINGVPDNTTTKDVDESFAGVRQLCEQYRKENGLATDQLVPVDAVTRSSCGLDPDVSVDNAMLQAPRVASARNLRLEQVSKVIHDCTQARDLGVLGEPRVNVLRLNLALDEMKQ